MKVPSLESMFSDIKSKISQYLGRDDIIISPGIPISDLLVSLPLSELRKVLLLLEFLDRTSTPSGVRNLLNDNEFFKEFSEAFGYNADSYRALIEREVQRKAWPAKMRQGTPAYVVAEIEVDATESVNISRNSILLSIGGRDFVPVVVGDDYLTVTPSDNKILVPFSSLDKGVVISNFLSVGDSVYISYYSPDVPVRKTIAEVKSIVDGVFGETLEEFLDRVVVFSSFSGNVNLNNYLLAILDDFGIEDYRIVFSHDRYFSPRPFGVDIWVKVPYISVSMSYSNSNNANWLGPQARSYYSYSSTSPTPPRAYPFRGSAFDTSTSGINPIIPSLQSYIMSNTLFSIFPFNYIMVRKADAIYVKKIKLEGLELYPFASLEIVSKELKGAIRNYLLGRKIGEKVTASDILRVVLEHKAVDNCGDVKFMQYCTTPDCSTGSNFGTNGISSITPDKVSEYVSCVNLDKFELEIS